MYLIKFYNQKFILNFVVFFLYNFISALFFKLCGKFRKMKFNFEIYYTHKRFVIFKNFKNFKYLSHSENILQILRLRKGENAGKMILFKKLCLTVTEIIKYLLYNFWHEMKTMLASNKSFN